MTTLRILALTYKTFPAPLSAVYEAAVDVLKHMGMRVLPQGSGQHDGSVGILASGWRRQLDVEMEAQGVKVTRVRVLAREGVFFEENAATELIAQVDRLLEQRRDTRGARPAMRTSASMTVLPTQAEPAALAG